MQNGINEQISAIMSLKQKGANPQQVMQMMFQQNPQLNQLITQFENMSQGRNPRDFIIQFAQQNGLNQQSIQFMQQLFGK